MMDKAADPLSETAFQIIQAIGWVTSLEFVKKYQVGAEISFIQPNTWRETQVNQRSIGAIVVLSFMASLAFFVVSLSILLHLCKSDQDRGNEKLKIIKEKELLLSKEDDFGGLLLSNDDHQSVSEFPTLPNSNWNTNNADPFNLGFSPRKLTSPKNQLLTNYTSITPRSDFVSSEASTDVFLHKKQPEVKLIVREKYKGSFFSNIVA